MSQGPLVHGSRYESGTVGPPPPPPKPTSRNQTPVTGPPLPPPPQGSQLYREQNVDLAQNRSLQGPSPGWLPIGLTEKSTQHLHQLIQSPELQTALLDNPATSHPAVAQSQAPLQQLLESNVALSERLLQLEKHVMDLRASTQSRLLGLRASEQQHRNKIRETENELDDFSPRALYQRLNASAQDQDAIVKALEESFLDEGGLASDREVQDFVRRVREAKKTAFLRNERKMRWDEGRVGGWR